MEKTPIMKKLKIVSFLPALLMFSSQVLAEFQLIGPGSGITDAREQDTPFQERLNVDRTFTTLGPGKYFVSDWKLNVHTPGGMVTPMLVRGFPPTYTAVWVGSPFNPSAGGVLTVPESGNFTLTGVTDIYAGFFTSGSGSGIIAIDANNSGSGSSQTDHDNSPSPPSAAGDPVGGFSHASLGRTYAFEISVAPLALADSDGDGIDDEWEIANFGDLTSSDGTGDRDSDGLTDAQEYDKNTDPNNADSDDDRFNDLLEITENTNPNDAENFPTRTLVLSAPDHGTINGADTYPLGASATLTALPDPGYVFNEWSTDAEGSDNPLTVTMDSDLAIGTTFGEDTRDPDDDGLSNFQEIVVHETDPNDADSDDDGLNDGLEIAENVDPNDADSYPTRTLIVSAPDNGTINGAGTYKLGTTATLNAVPNPGYVFNEWAGDAEGVGVGLLGIEPLLDEVVEL